MRVVALATLLLATDADAACNEAISPANAQKLFELLKDFKGTDGCALDEVKTERDVMYVGWARAQTKLEPVTVRPKSCSDAKIAGPVFAMTAPPATISACPAAVAQMTSLITRETFGGVINLVPTPLTTPNERPRNISRLAAAAGAAAIVAWLVARRRR